MTRWVVRAYRGSSEATVEHISRIERLGTQMLVKKIIWAASGYKRDIPILRKRTERILRESLGEEVGLTPEKGQIANATVTEDLDGGESPDGSKRDGHTAGGTTKDLGTRTTVTNAEMLGIAVGNMKVVTDSMGATGRILEPSFTQPRS